jgi:hypothetical protein
MSQTYCTAAVLDAMCEAAFPSSTVSHTATATNGTTTLTFSVSDSESILVGMTLTGAGITGSANVTAVNNGTGVATISGTISTLTTSSYSFTMTIYGSLHTTTPGYTGANEASGGSYARQSETFGAPATGVKTSTNAQNWTNMPSATIGYFGFWTASTSGTWLAGGALGSSLTVPSGATVSAAIGAITATVSG